MEGFAVFFNFKEETESKLMKSLLDLNFLFVN